MTLEENEGIILTVLYAITMLVTFAGNGFLIYIVWKKPEVRSLTSFMFVNIAGGIDCDALVDCPYLYSRILDDTRCMLICLLSASATQKERR